MGADADEAKKAEEAKGGKEKKVEEPEGLIDGFLDDDAFSLPESIEDEKESSEEEESTSTVTTPEGDAGGKNDEANEKDAGDKGGKPKVEDDESSESGTTIPKSRFDQVIAERNETRKANAALETRLAVLDELGKQSTKKEEKESEEDEEELDRPFMGSIRDFNEAVKAQAAEVADERVGSVREDLARFKLRQAEREFRGGHKDYDKIVYESGFFGKINDLAKAGDKEALGIVRDILSSDDGAAELYEAAREIQGLAPPKVDKIDADNWDQVQPVLERLGLTITEEKWAERRTITKGKKPAGKKETKKAQDEEESEDPNATLRGAPSGDGDAGKSTESESVELDKLFTNF